MGKQLTDGKDRNFLVSRSNSLPQEKDSFGKGTSKQSKLLSSSQIIKKEDNNEIIVREAEVNTDYEEANYCIIDETNVQTQPPTLPKSATRPILPEPYFDPREEIRNKWANTEHPEPEYKRTEKKNFPPPEKQYLPRHINKALIALLAVFTTIFFVSIVFLYNAFQDKQTVPAKDLTGDELLDKAIMEHYNRGYSINKKVIIKSGEKYQDVIAGNAKSVFLTNKPVDYSDKNGFGKIEFDKILDINMLEKQKRQTLPTPHSFQIAADQETKFVWMIYDNSQRELFSNVNTWLSFFENTIANFTASVACCLVTLLMIGSFIGAIVSTIMLIVQSANPKKLIYQQC